MSASLVGSEMCIRDSSRPARKASLNAPLQSLGDQYWGRFWAAPLNLRTVSYTHLTLPTICSV
eukprot:3846183-Alexandrium_andersonii.AAC.1